MRMQGAHEGRRWDAVSLEMILRVCTKLESVSLHTALNISQQESRLSNCSIHTSSYLRRFKCAIVYRHDEANTKEESGEVQSSTPSQRSYHIRKL